LKEFLKFAIEKNKDNNKQDINDIIARCEEKFSEFNPYHIVQKYNAIIENITAYHLPRILINNIIEFKKYTKKNLITLLNFEKINKALKSLQNPYEYIEVESIGWLDQSIKIGNLISIQKKTDHAKEIFYVNLSKIIEYTIKKNPHFKENYLQYIYKNLLKIQKKTISLEAQLNRRTQFYEKIIEKIKLALCAEKSITKATKDFNPMINDLKKIWLETEDFFPKKKRPFLKSLQFIGGISIILLLVYKKDSLYKRKIQRNSKNFF